MDSQDPQIAQSRKDDHVHHALQQQNKAIPSQFDQIRFIHQSLNHVSFDQIDISTEWAHHRHSHPFYINGMTGGSRFTKQFNDKLAQVAAETGLAMASGSVSAALKDPSVIDTFQIIRERNPKGFVMANIGAHHSLDNAKRAVDILRADALQIHLNIPQEVVMPEGDRNYSMWEENIETIVNSVGVPVIIKEVGFGMSQETIQRLLQLGVETIDVSGRGGTNFITIENERRDHLDFSAIAHWGQTTPESLLEAQNYIDKATILASGGIRNYMDIIKALALGASATGISGLFLKKVNDDGIDATIQMVHDWTDSLKHLYLLLGVNTTSNLNKLPLILSSELLTYAQQRKLDLTKLQ